MARRLWCVGFAVAASLSTGCALRKPTSGLMVTQGGELGKPVTLFPSKEQLAIRLHRPSPPEVADQVPGASVSRWTIASAIPSPHSSYSVDGIWDQLLVDALGGKSIAASAELRCAARELARMFVEYGGLPDESLRNFVTLGCGSSLASTDLGLVYSNFSGKVADQRIEQELGPKVDQLVSQAIGTVPSQMGLGYARDQKRAAIVVLLGRARGKLAPFAREIRDNHVDVTGIVAEDASYVMGLVNHGQYGVRRCELNRQVPLPRFSLHCPIAEQDPRTTIEIVTRPAGSMLWQVDSRLLASRDAASRLTYELPVADSAAPVANGTEDFATALFRAVNDTRRKAGFAQVELLPLQSTSNRQLAPSLYQASRSKNIDDAQTIALGLLAGWDVPGDIREGAIYWASYAPVADATRFRDAALGSPMGRFGLLNPSMTKMAIGSHHYEPGGTMAIVTSYALFDGANHDRDEEVVFKEVTALRRARGRSAPHRLPRSSSLGEALARIRDGKQSVSAVMSEMAEQSGVPSEGPVQVWAVETNSLYEFPVPDGLYGESIDCEIGVTHYKPDGAAWGQYVILFVVHRSSSAQAGQLGVIANFG